MHSRTASTIVRPAFAAGPPGPRRGRRPTEHATAYAARSEGHTSLWSPVRRWTFLA
jgi:hypothetical protein